MNHGSVLDVSQSEPHDTHWKFDAQWHSAPNSTPATMYPIASQAVVHASGEFPETGTMVSGSKILWDTLSWAQTARDES